MQREALLLSVRPIFANRIMEGIKTAELRRVRPGVSPGQAVLIYSSSPTMALLGSAAVERVEAAAPSALWPRVRHAAGVSEAEYLGYFAGATSAAAIWLSNVVPLTEPIPLPELRRRWPWFRPPQSYCFVRAHVDPPNRTVESRAASPPHNAAQ